MATILVQHLMNYINPYPITLKVHITSLYFVSAGPDVLIRPNRGADKAGQLRCSVESIFALIAIQALDCKSISSLESTSDN
jgi:hypothetical protein